jgi:hypothetical protein
MIVEDEAFIFDGKAIERMFKNQQLKPPSQIKEREKADAPAKKADKDKPKKKMDEQEACNTFLYLYTSLPLHHHHCAHHHSCPLHAITRSHTQPHAVTRNAQLHRCISL